MHDNLPTPQYKVNSRTPMQWFVNNYIFSTHKDSKITNYPLEGVKEGEIQAIIERLVYVEVRSDEIMEEISKHEFEPKETKVIKTHATLFD